MTKYRTSICLAATVAMSSTMALADGTDVCRAMVDEAAHNVGIQMSSSDVLDTIYSNYCEADGSTKNSDLNAGLSAIISEVPVSFTGGAHDTQTQMKNFCSKYQGVYASHSAAFSYNSSVVEAALKSANDCLGIVSQFNDTISYRILTPQTLSVTFSIQPGQTLNIRGITHDQNVTCIGDNVTSTGAVRYATGQGQSMTAAAGPYTITCSRTAFSTQGGTAFYNATAVIVDTNVGPLNITWPQETQMPLTTASQLQATMIQMAKDTADLKASVAFNFLPIGTIIPWYEKNQAPPPGWAPCDGSDAAHCPDLTGLFLLGGHPSEVANAGGSLSTQFGINISDQDMHGDGNGWNRNNNKFTKNEPYTINLPRPPYTTVLYIMKISNTKPGS